MPIRPEERDRYPTDWPAISKYIRKVRASERCECRGECGRRHGGRCRAINGLRNPRTGSKVVLTVAHLDHQPENNDFANLRAFCQDCHLTYDAKHHAETRARNRTANTEPLWKDTP